MRNRVRHLVGLIVVPVVVAALCSTALAAGIAVARFGGEHGNPVAANPSTIYYNPAGLAFESGHRLMIDGIFAFRDATYTRPEDALTPVPMRDATDLDIAANTGEGHVSNFLISPFIGFATDFGLDIPLSVGVGFFAPFGGKSVWDQVDPIDGAPGAIDGPQRWYVTEGTIQTLVASIGIAYRIPSIRLSIGVAGNLNLSTIDTIRARNSDGGDDLTNDSGVLKEGRSWLVVDSTDISMGAGIMWEPIENTLWVGASYQSQPGFGQFQMEGTLTNLVTDNPPSDKPQDVIVTQELPDITRLGFRYRPTEDLELRLFGDYTRWSTYDMQCIVPADVGNISEACAVDRSGAQLNPPNLDVGEEPTLIQNLLRRWEDSFGVRVGASYWLLDRDLELMLGGGFDSNAIPDEYLEPALMDFDKVTATAAARYEFTSWFAATLGLTNVFYLERDTRGLDTARAFDVASRQPSSAGIYEQNVFLVNTNLEFTFGGNDDETGEEVEDDAVTAE